MLTELKHAFRLARPKEPTRVFGFLRVSAVRQSAPGMVEIKGFKVHHL